MSRSHLRPTLVPCLALLVSACMPEAPPASPLEEQPRGHHYKWQNQIALFAANDRYVGSEDGRVFAWSGGIGHAETFMAKSVPGGMVLEAGWGGCLYADDGQLTIHPCYLRDPAQLFWFEHVPEGYVRVRSRTDFYLSLDPVSRDIGIRDVSLGAGVNERFRVVDLEGEEVPFLPAGAQHLHLVPVPNSSWGWSEMTYGKWNETPPFQMINLPDGKVAFRTFDGRFLRATSWGAVLASYTSIHGETTFELIETQEEDIYRVKTFHGRYLCDDFEDQRVYAFVTPSQSQWECTYTFEF